MTAKGKRTRVKSRVKQRADDVLIEDVPATELPDAELDTPREDLLAADYQLAQRCVLGEVAAWEQLHKQCNGNLLRIVGLISRMAGGDADLAEEITARVWYALVAGDGERLSRYDPARGARLITYLRAIALDEVRRHFRSERRRRNREFEFSRQRPQHYSTESDQVDVTLNEFLETLSSSEREFCREYLLDTTDSNGKSGPTEKKLTRANFWQKTHRVYERFVRFFGNDA